MKKTASKTLTKGQLVDGGELHQAAGGTHPQMTNQTGTVVSDDENSLKAGSHGPALLEDHFLLEKTQHFDHERIPERVVHARGFGAHGFFELTHSLAGVSKAGVLNRVGEKVPVFTRFSTVAGNMGSSDLARDVRGFAVKFYTPEGNWDLVGNNIPVFFIQDAIKFTDLIHSVKQEPDRGFPQAQSAHDTFWDFVSLTPQGITYVETKGDMSDIHRFPQAFPHITTKPSYANLLHSLSDQQVVELRIVLPL